MFNKYILALISFATISIVIVSFVLFYQYKYIRDVDYINYLARTGNFIIIENKISAGYNINTKDRNGMSLLHFSVIDNNNKLFEYCISKGAAIDVVNREGETPLITAIQKDNYEMVCNLIKIGANVNVRTKSGYSPILISAMVGNNLIFKKLLQSGSNIYDCNMTYYVIHEASLSGNDNRAYA